MSLNSHQPPDETDLGGQSPGCDPKSKRNSGLFAFLKWFKPSTSRESVDDDDDNSSTASCDSLDSTNSDGTVASFSYVPPADYNPKSSKKKCLVLGPETDTYKARLKQRDKRRENDKNLTLRKKYNLFFHRDLPKTDAGKRDDEENSRSLPLMTRADMIDPKEEEKIHRRTNSESSKTKRAGAYLHVKGKRKAPQPPGLKQLNEGATSTMSLRRRKKLAPPPPSAPNSPEGVVLFNDSLKLDHGILKPAKEADDEEGDGNSAPNTSTRSSYVEVAPVSPRPWYKRNNKNKEAPKYEVIDPEVPPFPIGEKHRKSEDNNKRKSGMSFLTNISELDREASEILKKEHSKSGGNGSDLQEIPQFMRPKEQSPEIAADVWVSPKRRSSAKDLIAKFNAITNVTKVTVNTALFGGSTNGNNKEAKRDYFGKRTSLSEDKRHHQESLLETHKKRIEQIDNKKVMGAEAKFNSPLMKSESATSAIKSKSPNKAEQAKLERKNWNCRKCSVENEYWRIICQVCSAIKPYFDDLGGSPISPPKVAKEGNNVTIMNDKVLERSKTQIGFSALASYNLNRSKNFEKSISLEDKTQKDNAGNQNNKTEERERLKKMLIEMKNSLPKRRSNILMKQNSRTSIIVENSDNEEEPINDKPENKKNPCEEKVAEVIIATRETVYENIKVKKTDNPKPIKVSSSAQTTSGFTKIPNKTAPEKGEPKENGIMKSPSAKKIDITAQSPPVDANSSNKKNFELMRPKDFENIYTDSNSQSPARVYANLARNDELSLFFNVPKKINEIKNNYLDNNNKNSTDTIEINRLLRRLESSIAKGELTEASIYAKELAQLKINCSVIRQNSQNVGKKKKGFNIEMYVEDKISHRGPFTIEVTENQTVAELKNQVEQEFEIPANVQRWILGKELASHDKATLKDHKITSEGCPVFLYLVAPDSTTKTPTRITPEQIKNNSEPSTSQLLPVIRPKLTESGGAVTKNLDENNKAFKRSVSSEPPKVIIPPGREIRKVKTVEEIEMRIPKIVDVIPKSVENYEIKINQNPNKKPIVRQNAIEVKPIQVELKAKDEAPELPKLQLNQAKVEIVKVIEPKSPLAATTQKTQIPVTVMDLDEDYDTKTLKPQKPHNEWECHLCTLLNPITSNICAICATVRQNNNKEAGNIVVRKSVKNKRAPQPSPIPNDAKDQTYQQLVNLDNKDLVENLEQFECLVCFTEIEPGQGITLRECLHQFCKACLAHTIEYTEDAEVKCPYRDDEYSCNIALQDREIKALVTPRMYEQHLAKSVKEAENKIGKSFHCKTPDCRGWCIFEDNVNEFYCPVCRRINCLTCQAIHMSVNCKQYQEKVTQESEMDEDTKRTKEMFEEMVRKGEALTCPTCQVILMKKWGCDWVRCSMCKTEICWVTRGPRWGPAGKGDTSGGCQCGVNGVKCHPQCSYCH